MEAQYSIKNLHVRLTSRCNFDCLHCYAASWKLKKLDLEKSLVCSSVEQAIDLGLQSVTFTGGEPLLHKDLVEIVQFCLSRNLKVSIESNGFLLDAFLARRFQGLEKIKFNISYDGSYIRHSEKCQKIRENIEALAKGDMQVRAQTVIMPLNSEEAELIFDYTKRLGIKNRVFMGHNQVEKVKRVKQFAIDSLLDLRKKLLEKYDHLQIELPELIGGKASKGCGWGCSRCEIMPNGDVTSCAPIAFNRPGFIAGNIKEHFLERIWNGEHFRRIRLLKQEDFKGFCAKCKFWFQCKGSCRAAAASVGGDILSPYPVCQEYVRRYPERAKKFEKEK